MVTVTTTTTVTTAPSLQMSLSSTSNATSLTTSKESIDSLPADMDPFIPDRCLFCPKHSPNFTESVNHMQKAHGLFVPHRDHLAVDLETLFKYLHLVIFGYRECLQCGTERSTVQAVQQHMIGKGHCKFDVSEQDSEFVEFYDFSEDDSASDDGDGDHDTSDREVIATSPSQKPLLVDDDSIRLPSGRIISKRSATQTGLSIPQLRRRNRTATSQIEYTTEPDNAQESNQEAVGPDARQSQALTKREKRERATAQHQLARMSANDRGALMHLPASQQRAILAAQFRHEEKVQKEERRKQGKIDRKGNKNLYAYWHTETPVYQCG